MITARALHTDGHFGQIEVGRAISGGAATTVRIVFAPPTHAPITVACLASSAINFVPAWFPGRIMTKVHMITIE